MENHHSRVPAVSFSLLFFVDQLLERERSACKYIQRSSLMSAQQVISFKGPFSRNGEES